MKQAQPRRDHEQTIRKLVNVQREVLRAACETQMHESVIATITRSPRAAFDAPVY